MRKIIDHKPVRRCEKCGHLIPRDLHTCPYCQGSFTINRVPKAPTGNTEPMPVQPPKLPRERKPLSANAKRNMKFCALGIGIGVAAWLIIMFVLNATKLNRSILTPFEWDEVVKLEEKYPGFAEKYEMIEKMRNSISTESEEEEFGEITYKQAMEYLDHYTDTAYCNTFVNEALQDYEDTYHEPMLSKVAEVKQEWEKYMEDHNPDNYLKLTYHQRYERDGSYYYAGFYFTMEFPKGDISDCYVYYRLKHKEYGFTHVDTYNNLSELQERNSSNHYRWTRAYGYEADTYDTYEPECEIRSVTLMDGTVISPDDLDNVPQVVKNYLDDPSEFNEYLVIVRLIDKKYPSKVKVVSDYVAEKLEQEDPLVFKLLEMTNERHEVVGRGWNFFTKEMENHDKMLRDND